jgi:hypothetical protein
MELKHFMVACKYLPAADFLFSFVLICAIKEDRKHGIQNVILDADCVIMAGRYSDVLYTQVTVSCAWGGRCNEALPA